MTYHRIRANEEIPQIVAREAISVLRYLVAQNGGIIEIPTNIEGINKLFPPNEFRLDKHCNRNEDGEVLNFRLELVR